MEKVLVLLGIGAVIFLMFAAGTMADITARSIALKAGWNFISFPEPPQDENIEVVLKDIKDKVVVAWGYDNALQKWEKYKPGEATGLAKIKFGRGYWFYAKESCLITYQTNLMVDKTIILYPGWNLIGFNQDSGSDIAAATSLIGNDWRVIWSWENGEWFLVTPYFLNTTVKPLSKVSEKKAYWIKMNSEKILVPSYTMRKDDIRLISSELLSDKGWKYNLGLPVSFISGARDKPFAMGEFNGWSAQELKDSDGDDFYELEITVFNRLIRLNYGGNKAANSWASLKSSFFSFEDLAVIGFYEGKLYGKDEMPSVPPRGDVHDDYVGFFLDATGKKLTIWLNNNKVDNTLVRPFFMSDYGEWKEIAQNFFDSSGWGNVVLDNIVQPVEINFGFGGDLAAGSWANAGGEFYDSVKRNFRVCVKDNIISNCR